MNCLDDEFAEYFGRPEDVEDEKKAGGSTSLSLYGTDLTKLAREGRLDDCYGREKELAELMEILVRRQKNNPVLVGDAGVGKSAIVELFATKLANNLVPFVLTGRTVINLDLGRVVAGSRYRGEFEGRFRKLLDEALSQPNIIIFIDEIHTLNGTGSAEGSLDAANMLKPILARNGFQCIGATTTKEYETIEKDPALHRRFQPIIVNQPTVNETVDILYALRTGLEAFHNVEIMPAALQAAAELSDRYINDRYLPDKAIDLVDRAAAKEVVKLTDVQEYTLISSLVNGALRHLSQLKTQAFRCGDITSQFIFHELDNAYRNFLFQWVDNPTKIPLRAKDLTKKERQLLRSPLSQELFTKMRRSVLARSDELMYVSPESQLKLKPIPKITNLSIGKYREVLFNFQKSVQKLQNNYFKQLISIRFEKQQSIITEDSQKFLADYNEEIFTNISNFRLLNKHLFKKWYSYYGNCLKKVTSLGRISYFTYDLMRHYDLFEPSTINISFLDKTSKKEFYHDDDTNFNLPYYRFRNKKIKHSSNKKLGILSKKYFHSYGTMFDFAQFATYARSIRYRIQKKVEAYTAHSDFFKQDIEIVSEIFDFFNQLEATKASIVKDFLQDLRPVLRMGIVQSLNNQSLNFKLTDEQLQYVYLLLGYYNTETGKEFFASFEQAEVLKKARRKKNYSHLKTRISPAKIKQVLSDITGIPIESINVAEQTKLKNLENILHERVIGQDDAVAAISRAIRRARLGFQNPNRPIASFLFCGPTGVGKTEICKALAYVMFGSEKNMIRFDMSEFMEKFTVSRLIGSPPGYVGYEEGGQLSDTVRKKPYSVVLFDEVEKAHPDVLNILLQILEDGRLTDTQKRLISFENTIIIMTSNAGAGEIQEFLKKNPEPGLQEESEATVISDQSTNLDTEDESTIRHVDPYFGVVKFLKSPIKEDYFSDMRDEIQKQWKKSVKDLKNYQVFQKKVLEDIEKQKKKKIKRSIKKQLLKNSTSTVSSTTLSQEDKDQFNLDLKNTVLDKLGEFFLPEFLNRLDDIIIFRPLKPVELRRICDLMIAQVTKRFQEKDITLTVENSVRIKLAKEGYNPAFGARPLRRLITRYVEDLVSETMLKLENPQEKSVEIAIKLDENNEIYASTILEVPLSQLEKKKNDMSGSMARVKEKIEQLAQILEKGGESVFGSIFHDVKNDRKQESSIFSSKSTISSYLSKYFFLGASTTFLDDPKILTIQEESLITIMNEMKELFGGLVDLKDLVKIREAKIKELEKQLEEQLKQKMEEEVLV